MTRQQTCLLYIGRFCYIQFRHYLISLRCKKVNLGLKKKNLNEPFWNISFSEIFFFFFLAHHWKGQLRGSLNSSLIEESMNPSGGIKLSTAVGIKDGTVDPLPTFDLHPSSSSLSPHITPVTSPSPTHHHNKHCLPAAPVTQDYCGHN